MSKSKLFTFLLIFLSLSAIFSFYNFDSASAQGVTWTYNADTNTATASGSGSTNFAELVAYDIAGGWGGIYTADATGTQIVVGGKIVIGDGSNAITFTDSAKEVLWTNFNDWGSGNLITLSAHATATFGINPSGYQTNSGCSFNSLSNNVILFYSSDSSSSLNFFGCTVKGYACYIKAYNTPTKFYDTNLDSVILRDSYALDFYNSRFDDSISALVSSYGTFDYMRGYANPGGWYLIYLSDVISVTIKNGVFSGVPASGTPHLITSGSTSVDSYMINTVTNNWNLEWTGTCTGKVYRQYEFDLNVLNGEITDFVQNANVTLFKDGSKIYSALTNSSGMIPTQTLTYGYYQQATGSTIQNATSPYYLVISHPDWQTYISRFYITQPLRLTVSMQEPTYTGYTEAEKSDYTTIILFVISLILCIIGLALTVPFLPLISLTISVINIIFLSEPSIFNILLIVLNVIFTIIALVRVKTKNN